MGVAFSHWRYSYLAVPFFLCLFRQQFEREGGRLSFGKKKNVIDIA